MRYIIVLLTIMLTACTTAVPVTAKFPDAPSRSMVACPQLKSVEEKTTLSKMTETVTVNYSTYYDCAVKLDGFIEWYEIQKRIFESAGK